MNENIPIWNLEGIYPSPSSEAFSRDIALLGKICQELKAAARDRASAMELIALRDKGLAIALNLTAYASALLSTDSSDPEYLRVVAASERAEAEFSKAEDAFLRAFPDDGDMPDEYRYIASEFRNERRHLMTSEEEALASDLATSGSSLWEHLQENLASSISDGETLTALRSLAYSDDRDVRRKAFERELELLKRHAPAFAFALSGVKGTVLTLDARRGWSSPLERSLFESRLSQQAFNALIEVIESALPMFHEYFRIKAKLIGTDDFSFYDLFAPVGGTGRTFTFEEASDIVVSSFTAFSEDAGAFASSALSSGWVDALIRPGKAGGAYDTYFPLCGESRVFMNFDGSYDSVLTLSHELGHAYHDHILSTRPMSLATYPMTLAETASTFSEKLVFQHVLELSDDGNARKFAIEQFLQSAAQTIVDIYSRYLFEKAAFERIAEGPLSADDASALMLDAEERAYGNAISVKHPYMWAVKSHYYSADFSYYNYPYAFGELFALSLFMTRNEPGFEHRYRELLMNTGCMSADEAAFLAGADITRKEFWQSGIAFIGSYIEELGNDCKN